MTDVQIIQGVPGGGKTYELRERVEDRLQDGEKTVYLNFTNAGTDTTEDELAEKLRIHPDNTPMRVSLDDEGDRTPQEALAETITGTLHSVAYRLAHDSGFIDGTEQIIMPSHAPGNPYPFRDDFFPEKSDVADQNLYEVFCERKGLQFAVNPNTPMEAVLRDDGIDAHDYENDGNAVFAAFTWARMRFPPSADRAAKARKAPVDAPVPGSRVEQLYRDWEAFKDNPPMGPPRKEHADYIDAVIENRWAPKEDVLCIDEFQDLSPLEHEMLRMWIRTDAVDAVVLAGDVNQSIYSFRGARPAFMKTMQDDLPSDQVTVKTSSRRCADRVTTVAEALIDGMDGTVAIDSHESTGSGTAQVDRIDGIGDIGDVVEDAVNRNTPRENENDAAVMLLSRTNKVAAAAADALRRGGIPYEVLGNEEGRDPYTRGGMPPAWGEKTLMRVAALRRMVEGGAVTDPQKDVVLDVLPRSDERARAVTMAAKRSGEKYTDAVPAEAMRAAVSDADTIRDVVEMMDVSESRSECIRRAVIRDIPVDRSLVKVGTVHSAKGLSADAVLLLDAYPAGVARRYGTDESLTGEEKRVSYVAVTRARDEFRLVRGVREDVPPGHREQWPMFRDGLPGVNGGDQA